MSRSRRNPDQDRSSRKKNKQSKAQSSYSEKVQEIRNISPQTENQQHLMRSINYNPITVASGAAGVGKTLIALYIGAQMLDHGLIDQILFLKPITDFKGSKGIGFLPGDLDEKVAPLLAPVRDNLTVFMSHGKAETMIRKGEISFQVIDFLRGRSLRDKFVILDEAQNTDSHGVKTVMSRLEESSKLVILGDKTQCDVKYRNEPDGLSDAFYRLRGLSQVGLVEFTTKDIVRNSFIKDVLARYDE